MHARQAFDTFFERSEGSAPFFQLAQVLEPRTHAKQCCSGTRIWNAQTFDQGEFFEAIRHRARIKRSDGSAHRMTNKREAWRSDLIDQTGDISDVIGEVVIAASSNVRAVPVPA